MKAIYFLIMLFVSLSVYGKGIKKYQKEDLEAIKMAYNILKVYYPSDNELCVADSIYDHEWYGFIDMVDDKTSQKLESFRIEKKYVWDEPVYSKQLFRIFGPENKNCKYVAEFSEPYNQMIRCDILPIDRKVGMSGAPRINVFLFRYDDNGEIYQTSKIIRHIN